MIWSILVFIAGMYVGIMAICILAVAQDGPKVEDPK